MSRNTVATYLAEHPRMAGVLFVAVLLLPQFGVPMGGNGYPGP